MLQLIDNGVYLVNRETLVQISANGEVLPICGQVTDGLLLEGSRAETARQNTMAYQILMRHNTSGDPDKLKIRFDALASHDITYVGIIQTARASGLKEFPLPYVLTNCHNSLCAVGGTINEDDHVFGLSAAQKYGGIYVPAHMAVIHQYMREMMSACGHMILGSDSHTRYGALGTMAIGEGGPELVKQLLQKTYDIAYPEIIAVYMEGKPRPGVGPQDVALAIIGAVFEKNFVNNKVLEFIGPGIKNLSVDYRNGIDVMTTETTCLSSIWTTDDKVKDFYRIHGRPEAYKELHPGALAYYDGALVINLDKIEPMIALPFHPSNVYKISELNRNAGDILPAVEAKAQKQLDNPNIRFALADNLVNGRLRVDQGIVAGCAGGTFENLYEIASLSENRSIGKGALAFSVYPASQPIYMELIQNGAAAKMMAAGITIKTAFCGPCFGAGDVPANGTLSIRHTTRNFPNREGSKPGDGQISSVALMDARSIAATVFNGGYLTPATEMDLKPSAPVYAFNNEIYEHRVYQGFRQPLPREELKFGPNIADWPTMIALPEHLLLKVATVITDPVTTTDELIPSGETSSYRSNPMRLAQFTLSRKDPEYVSKAAAIDQLEKERRAVIKSAAQTGISDALQDLCKQVIRQTDLFEDTFDMLNTTGIGSVIYALKPGDGSAREQAASCQKVLGGWANLAVEYATKRYRSNLVNWGLLPFTVEKTVEPPVAPGELIFIPHIKEHLKTGEEEITALILSAAKARPLKLYLNKMTADEREIILKGSLINYYAN
ncbi:Aconitase/3-isopropylmalate dehydratase large subunit, alpha/beta/alpha [Syntrophomonas zehnderi OL-4]|uniref:Aconitase/3-isopropylmalate dehydratase large subunit, alpha/beta/alpha n=1 Tax=Syntrophomonas zehnderi OL-4 TaxID=690567 RepID=A0A0E4C826_9FIRM|nr:hydratase [Syntrophomonas zehnderi]CFX23651.1 Aconitase/3-isopropylmalate dehydratase large subunit, alpha/beta/alpha [Syntrophomonas zehnderi OL-4]